MTASDDIELSRRDIVRAGAVATVSLAAASLPAQQALAAGAPTISGVVFEDRSGTGRRQAGDRGIPGVLVSNGREVVRTDAGGRYTLPIDEETIVFVIKPSGYAVPTDEDRLPQFYYTYQPKGSPAALDLRFRGIDPTGPLPESVDFPLRKIDEPTSFDVLLFTDPQPESDVELSFVRDDIINSVIGAQAAFGISMGDIMFDDLSLYGRHNRLIAQIGVPWYNVAGNHDLNFEAPDSKYSRETFKRIYGPSYYAFEYGNALFLLLDNVEYLGADAGKANKSGKYRGRIGEQQLTFVANVLSATPTDRLVVIGLHIPLQTYVDANDPMQNTVDRPELLKLLSERSHAVSFSGHTHTTEHHYFGAEDGYAGDVPHHHHVLTAVSGSWWSGPLDHRGIAVADSRDGSPNGFHVLSIAGNRYTTRFVPAKEPNGRQMRIMIQSEFHGTDKELYRDFRAGELLGSPITHDAVFSTHVIVNFFDGGPRTAVEYQIGKRSPIKMQREQRLDPFVQEEFARNEATKKPWVKAVSSSHIWTARLPADLEAGTHCLRARVIDEYGREHRDHLVIEVTGGEKPSTVRGGS
jgi:C terminal of Calcineurin-like phosphoesterase/N terminal of Calcineurin-like phosphoesterase/Calcineurin-like phosphoesterase